MAAELNDAVTRHYEDPFRWFDQGVRSERLEPVVRPVHPEYYTREGPWADAERARIFTVMRIDCLLDFWRAESPRRDALAGVIGVEPRDAESWRAFLQAVFDLAAVRGAVGIKQLQAYHRDLGFAARADADIAWNRGGLSPDQVRTFQDWVVLECCRLAEERGWPHQVHVGTHNLGASSPLPLADLAQRYPNMKIVLLHCWPFLDEAGWLAKHCANIYIDACWQTILNPSFLKRSLDAWLHFVPMNKMMFSQDATSMEMAAGSADILRKTIEEALDHSADQFGTSGEDLDRMARALLHGNGVGLYGVDKRP